MDKELAKVTTQEATDIVYRPAKVIESAIEASKRLQEVIKRKPKPVVIQGNHYLEFEDWQTCGRFYGVSAKATDAEPVELNGVRGFKASAVALKDGVEISGATAYCMQDEPNWKGKPVFQLASMAQTRACAKALRNVLGWVVVLAGYKTTPAEELDRAGNGFPNNGGKSNGNYDASGDERLISPAQRKRLFAISRSAGVSEESIRAHLINKYGIEKTSDIKRCDYEEICKWAESADLGGE